MGSSSSSPQDPTPADLAGSLGMEELRESGRYVALPHPSGGTVHVLGVYPCSARSVSEVRVLLDAVEPSSVYVDVYPEQLQLMQQEVKQHVQTLMLGDAESGAGAGAAAASAAAPSSRAPGTKRTRGTATHRGPADINDPGSSAATRAVGDASSVLVLSAARRKELETLIGIGDVYTSKLGLAGAAELRMLVADDAFMRLMGIGRDAPYMAAVEWSERRRLDGAEPVPVAPYVFPMEYRDKQAVVRPAGTYVTLIGAPPMYTSIHILMGVNGIPQPDFEMELCAFRRSCAGGAGVFCGPCVRLPRDRHVPVQPFHRKDFARTNGCDHCVGRSLKTWTLPCGCVACSFSLSLSLSPGIVVFCVAHPPPRTWHVHGRQDYTFESVDSAKELRASATKDNEVIVAQLVEDAAKQAAATAFSLQVKAAGGVP